MGCGYVGRRKHFTLRSRKLVLVGGVGGCEERDMTDRCLKCKRQHSNGDRKAKYIPFAGSGRATMPCYNVVVKINCA